MFWVLTQFAKQLVSHVKSRGAAPNTGAASNTEFTVICFEIYSIFLCIKNISGQPV